MAKKPRKSIVPRARKIIYTRPRKHRWLIASDPAEPGATKVAAVPSKYKVTRACQRHAQLAAARIGADPRFV
jgi:hypothetical protein